MEGKGGNKEKGESVQGEIFEDSYRRDGQFGEQQLWWQMGLWGDR